jgi:hypothetical protein
MSFHRQCRLLAFDTTCAYKPILRTSLFRNRHLKSGRWLAALITRDPDLIALVAHSTKLHWFLLSNLVAVLLDRRHLMVQADIFRFLLTMGVIDPVLTSPEFPPPSDPFLPVLALPGRALLLGSAQVLRVNAVQTVLPSRWRRQS